MASLDFLFDNDNDKNIKSSENDNFVCETCGATEAYEDGAAGNLICANCFTQSQNVAYSQETVMDFEDIMGVAARNRAGGIKQKKNSAMSGPRKKRARQPLEELDTSKPLPDLKVCILAFQSVLKGSVKSIGEILRLEADDLASVMDTVGSIWSGYVRAWRDGAEKYGAMYPDLRFSMRDMFLNMAYLSRLGRVLSYRVAESVRLELEDQTDNKQGKIPGTEDADSDSDSDDNSTESEVGEVSSTKVFGKLRKRRPKSLSELVSRFRRSDMQGREEAALMLKPSMKLAAAIVWLALSSTGITIGQIVSWIANGSFPLLNAFDLLLTSKDQENLRSFRSFFILPSPPTADSIGGLAEKLAIVCGIKSTQQLPLYSDSDSDSEELNEPKVLERIRFVPLERIPAVIGQYVANLGFGQRVLDIAMALIGNPRTVNQDDERLRASLPPQRQKAERWLPPSLQRAHPRRVDSPEHALAIIVVACKMCPGWENWCYGRRTPSYDGGNGEQGQDVAARRRCHRFVPWNEEQFKLLQDNELISDYLDFYEEAILSNQADTVDNRNTTAPFPAFSALLDEACKKSRSKSESEASTSQNASLSEHSATAGEDTRLSKNQETTHVQPPCTASGFAPYISYPDKLSHSNLILAKDKVTLTAEPFHRCYSQLIEYIAYKTHTAAHKIHFFVAQLDEEVVALCKKGGKFRDKDAERKRKNRRKTKRSKRRATKKANMQSSQADYTADEIFSAEL